MTELVLRDQDDDGAGALVAAWLAPGGSSGVGVSSSRWAPVAGSGSAERNGR